MGAIMGNPCLRWNTMKMITKCNLRSIYQLINEQGLLYIHKIQATKTPTSLYEFYNTNNKNTRPKQNLHPTYKPKTILLRNSLFLKFSELYIAVPEDIKNIPELKFVKYSIRDYVNENCDPFTIPNLHDDINTTIDDE